MKMMRREGRAKQRRCVFCGVCVGLLDEGSYLVERLRKRITN
jgi:hypothetical protein